MLQALCYPGHTFRLAESSEYQLLFFFKKESQWIPKFKTSCLCRTLFLKWIGQQNDCLKKPRWTWKCSCSLSCTCSQRHCFRGCKLSNNQVPFNIMERPILLHNYCVSWCAPGRLFLFIGYHWQPLTSFSCCFMLQGPSVDSLLFCWGDINLKFAHQWLKKLTCSIDYV